MFNYFTSKRDLLKFESKNTILIFNITKIRACNMDLNPFHAMPHMPSRIPMSCHATNMKRAQVIYLCKQSQVFIFLVRFRLRYSTTCNSYYRDWSDAIDPSAKGVISGWDKVLYSVDSVHRLINEEAGQVISYR